MDPFWLTDAQFARIAPHLPDDTRGKARVDDRRVISGIVPVLKSGGRWTDAPRDVYGPKKTPYDRFVRWAAKGGLGRAVRDARPGRRAALPGADRLHRREGAPLRFWRQRGEQNQAIGRSRGGRTTQIHALTDRCRRPLAFLLTGGQVADCKAGALRLERLPACRVGLADKGYDSDAVRRQIEAIGAAPHIPPKVNHRWKPCFSPVLYRGRTAIERIFGRLKDFRRIATRYDPQASNYLPALCLAALCLPATVSYWL